MENKKIQVSCLGDSITFGLMASGADKSYPAVLGGLLGDKYDVRNFGHSGATVICDYDEVPDRYSPYLKTEAYENAMKSSPDIVILMLGMNDANPTHHFNEANGGPISEYYLGFYEKTLSEMIERVYALPTSPKVFLVKTTEMTRTVEEGFTKEYVGDFLENLAKLRELQERIAKKTGAVLIDTFDFMQNPSYYRDGCHLTDEGYARLAHAIFAGMKDAL